MDLLLQDEEATNQHLADRLAVESEFSNQNNFCHQQPDIVQEMSFQFVKHNQ
jgi:hypothetical protein